MYFHAHTVTMLPYPNITNPIKNALLPVTSVAHNNNPRSGVATSVFMNPHRLVLIDHDPTQSAQSVLVRLLLSEYPNTIVKSSSLALYVANPFARDSCRAIWQFNEDSANRRTPNDTNVLVTDSVDHKAEAVFR
jgi:hypothetical protein